MNKNDTTKIEVEVPVELENALSVIDDVTEVALVTLPKIPEIESILAAFPEDVRPGIKLSKKQVTDLLRHSKISTFGVNNTLPMICRGEECYHCDTCFFYKASIAPEGERCPDEIMYLNQMIPQLISDMGVDIENYLEVSMVQEYASALLDKRRAENMIAQYGDVKEVATSIIQATGTALYTEQETPHVIIKERASKRLQQIRREMLSTREQRAKYKMTDDKDPSTKASNLKAKFIEISKREAAEKKESEENLDKVFKEETKE